MKTIVALYDEIEDARDVVDDLVDAGFDRSDISLVARDATGEYGEYLEAYDEDRDYEYDEHEYEYDEDDVGDAAAAGAGGGAVLGGLIGVLVGAGAFAIPGIGPVIAAGPLAAGLAGAGVGAVTGGMLGALVEWGIPEEEAEYYAEGVRRGGTLVAVKVADDDADDVVDVMNDYEPVDIDRRAEYWRTEHEWEGYDQEAEPYTAEELEGYREAREERWEEDEDVHAGERQAAGGVRAHQWADVDFGDLEPRFEEHYNMRYTATGYDYEQYTTAYRYGYDLAFDPRYGQREWSDIEPDVQERWAERNGGAWEEFKEAVRHGWHETREALGVAEEDYD